MTLKPDTFFMSEERWDDIEKDAEAREKAAQTPDQVWRSLALHAPMTMATAKRHGDVTKLVNFVCVLQRRIDAANEATKASELALQRQVSEYIKLKALVVELARAFGTNKNYPHSFPDELIKELMEVARPLVIEKGTQDLKGRIVTGIDWAKENLTPEQQKQRDRLNAQTEAYRAGMISQATFRQEIMGEFQDPPDHETQPHSIVKDRMKKWEY